MRVIGIDDKIHYDLNVAAVKEAYAQKASVQVLLRARRKELQAEQEKIWNSELKSFDALVEAHRSGSLAMGDYVEALARHSNDLPLSVQTFLEALALEKNMNDVRVEHERSVLVEQLTAQLSDVETRSLTEVGFAFKSGRINHSEFYSYLQKLCENNHVSLRHFPAMRDYIQYVLLTGSIEGEQLARDVQEAETAVYNSLAKTDAEKKLVADSRAQYLSEQLVEFALTKEEWEEYVPSNQILLPFEAFYREAEARDSLMAQNLANAAKKYNAKKIVLVTGGFHASGIRKQVTCFDYVSFVPKITQIASAKGSEYLSIFTQEKTPLDKLFAGEKLFLATPPAPQARLIKIPLILWLTDGTRDFGRTHWTMIKDAAGAIKNMTMSVVRKDENASTVKTMLMVALGAFAGAMPIIGMARSNFNEPLPTEEKKIADMVWLLGPLWTDLPHDLLTLISLRYASFLTPEEIGARPDMQDINVQRKLAEAVSALKVMGQNIKLMESFETRLGILVDDITAQVMRLRIKGTPYAEIAKQLSRSEHAVRFFETGGLKILRSAENKSGFTLIELLGALFLLGVLSAAFGGLMTLVAATALVSFFTKKEIAEITRMKKRLEELPPKLEMVLQAVLKGQSIVDVDLIDDDDAEKRNVFSLQKRAFNKFLKVLKKPVPAKLRERNIPPELIDTVFDLVERLKRLEASLLDDPLLRAEVTKLTPLQVDLLRENEARLDELSLRQEAYLRGVLTGTPAIAVATHMLTQREKIARVVNLQKRALKWLRELGPAISALEKLELEISQRGAIHHQIENYLDMTDLRRRLPDEDPLAIEDIIFRKGYERVPEKPSLFVFKSTPWESIDHQSLHLSPASAAPLRKFMASPLEYVDMFFGSLLMKEGEHRAAVAQLAAAVIQNSIDLAREKGSKRPVQIYSAQLNVPHRGEEIILVVKAPGTIDLEHLRNLMRKTRLQKDGKQNNFTKGANFIAGRKEPLNLEDLKMLLVQPDYFDLMPQAFTKTAGIAHSLMDHAKVPGLGMDLEVEGWDTTYSVRLPAHLFLSMRDIQRLGREKGLDVRGEVKQQTIPAIYRVLESLPSQEKIRAAVQFDELETDFAVIHQRIDDAINGRNSVPVQSQTAQEILAAHPEFINQFQGIERNVAVLHFQQGLSPDQIVDRVENVPLPVVESAITTVLEKLRARAAVLSAVALITVALYYHALPYITFMGLASAMDAFPKPRREGPTNEQIRRQYVADHIDRLDELEPFEAQLLRDRFVTGPNKRKLEDEAKFALLNLKFLVEDLEFCRAHQLWLSQLTGQRSVGYEEILKDRFLGKTITQIYSEQLPEEGEAVSSRHQLISRQESAVKALRSAVKKIEKNKILIKMERALRKEAQAQIKAMRKTKGRYVFYLIEDVRHRYPFFPEERIIKVLEELGFGLDTDRDPNIFIYPDRQKKTIKEPLREAALEISAEQTEKLLRNELNVIRLRGQGHSVGDIARQLLMSAGMVRVYEATARAKLAEKLAMSALVGTVIYFALLPWLATPPRAIGLVVMLVVGMAAFLSNPTDDDIGFVFNALKNKDWNANDRDRVLQIIGRPDALSYLSVKLVAQLFDRLEKGRRYIKKDIKRVTLKPAKTVMRSVPAPIKIIIEKQPVRPIKEKKVPIPKMRTPIKLDLSDDPEQIMRLRFQKYRDQKNQSELEYPVDLKALLFYSDGEVTEERLREMAAELGLSVRESDEDVSVQDEKTIVRQLIDYLPKLDEQQRELLTLRYIEEMEPDQVADAVGIPHSLFSTYHSLALSKLKSLGQKTDERKAFAKMETLAAVAMLSTVVYFLFLPWLGTATPAAAGLVVMAAGMAYQQNKHLDEVLTPEALQEALADEAERLQKYSAGGFRVHVQESKHSKNALVIHDTEDKNAATVFYRITQVAAYAGDLYIVGLKNSLIASEYYRISASQNGVHYVNKVKPDELPAYVQQRFGLPLNMGEASSLAALENFEATWDIISALPSINKLEWVLVRPGRNHGLPEPLFKMIHRNGGLFLKFRDLHFNEEKTEFSELMIRRPVKFAADQNAFYLKLDFGEIHPMFVKITRPYQWIKRDDLPFALQEYFDEEGDVLWSEEISDLTNDENYENQFRRSFQKSLMWFLTPDATLHVALASFPQSPHGTVSMEIPHVVDFVEKPEGMYVQFRGQRDQVNIFESFNWHRQRLGPTETWQEKQPVRYLKISPGYEVLTPAQLRELSPDIKKDLGLNAALLAKLADARERSLFMDLLYLLDRNWWLIEGKYSPDGVNIYEYHDKTALKNLDRAAIKALPKVEFEGAKETVGRIIRDRIYLGKLLDMRDAFRYDENKLRFYAKELGISLAILGVVGAFLIYGIAGLKVAGNVLAVLGLGMAAQRRKKDHVGRRIPIRGGTDLSQEELFSETQRIVNFYKAHPNLREIPIDISGLEKRTQDSILGEKRVLMAARARLKQLSGLRVEVDELLLEKYKAYIVRTGEILDKNGMGYDILSAVKNITIFAQARDALLPGTQDRRKIRNALFKLYRPYIVQARDIVREFSKQSPAAMTEAELRAIFITRDALDPEDPRRLLLRNHVLLRNEGLVIDLAKKEHKLIKPKRGERKIELEDAINAGNMGVIRAFDDFSLLHNTLFSTSATFLIKDAIKNEKKRVKKLVQLVPGKNEEDDNSQDKIKNLLAPVVDPHHSLIRDMISHLSPLENEVVRLRYWEDLAPLKIAEILTAKGQPMSHETVRRHLRIAIARMQWAAGEISGAEFNEAGKWQSGKKKPKGSSALAAVAAATLLSVAGIAGVWFEIAPWILEHRDMLAKLSIPTVGGLGAMAVYTYKPVEPEGDPSRDERLAPLVQRLEKMVIITDIEPLYDEYHNLLTHNRFLVLLEKMGFEQQEDKSYIKTAKFSGQSAPVVAILDEKAPADDDAAFVRDNKWLLEDIEGTSEKWVVQLFYLNRKSIAEIVEKTKVSEKGVREWIENDLERLKTWAADYAYLEEKQSFIAKITTPNHRQILSLRLQKTSFAEIKKQIETTSSKFTEVYGRAWTSLKKEAESIVKRRRSRKPWGNDRYYLPLIAAVAVGSLWSGGGLALAGVAMAISLDSLKNSLRTISKSAETAAVNQRLKMDSVKVREELDDIFLQHMDEFESEAIDYLGNLIGGKWNASARDQLTRLIIFLRDKYGVYLSGLKRSKKKKYYHPQVFPKDPEKRERALKNQLLMIEDAVHELLFDTEPEKRKIFERYQEKSGESVVVWAAEMLLTDAAADNGDNFPAAFAALLFKRPALRHYLETSLPNIDAFGKPTHERNIKRIAKIYRQSKERNTIAELYRDPKIRVLFKWLFNQSIKTELRSRLLEYQAIKESFYIKDNEGTPREDKAPFVVLGWPAAAPESPLVIFGAHFYGVYYLLNFRHSKRPIMFIESNAEAAEFIAKAILVLNLDDHVTVATLPLSVLEDHFQPASVGLVYFPYYSFGRSDVPADLSSVFERILIPQGRIVIEGKTEERSTERALNDMMDQTLNRESSEWLRSQTSWHLTYGAFDTDGKFSPGKSGYRDPRESPTLFVLMTQAVNPILLMVSFFGYWIYTHPELWHTLGLGLTVAGVAVTIQYYKHLHLGEIGTLTDDLPFTADEKSALKAAGLLSLRFLRNIDYEKANLDPELIHAVHGVIAVYDRRRGYPADPKFVVRPTEDLLDGNHNLTGLNPSFASRMERAGLLRVDTLVRQSVTSLFDAEVDGQYVVETNEEIDAIERELAHVGLWLEMNDDAIAAWRKSWQPKVSKTSFPFEQMVKRSQSPRKIISSGRGMPGYAVKNSGKGTLGNIGWMAIFASGIWIGVRFFPPALSVMIGVLFVVLIAAILNHHGNFVRNINQDFSKELAEGNPHEEVAAYFAGRLKNIRGVFIDADLSNGDPAIVVELRKKFPGVYLQSTDNQLADVMKPLQIAFVSANPLARDTARQKGMLTGAMGENVSSLNDNYLLRELLTETWRKSTRPARRIRPDKGISARTLWLGMLGFSSAAYVLVYGWPNVPVTLLAGFAAAMALNFEEEAKNKERVERNGDLVAKVERVKRSILRRFYIFGNSAARIASTRKNMTTEKVEELRKEGLAELQQLINKAEAVFTPEQMVYLQNNRENFKVVDDVLEKFLNGEKLEAIAKERGVFTARVRKDLLNAYTALVNQVDRHDSETIEIDANILQGMMVEKKVHEPVDIREAIKNQPDKHPALIADELYQTGYVQSPDPEEPHIFIFKVKPWEKIDLSKVVLERVDSAVWGPFVHDSTSGDVEKLIPTLKIRRAEDIRDLKKHLSELINHSIKLTFDKKATQLSVFRGNIESPGRGPEVVLVFKGLGPKLTTPPSKSVPGLGLDKKRDGGYNVIVLRIPRYTFFEMRDIRRLGKGKKFEWTGEVPLMAIPTVYRVLETIPNPVLGKDEKSTLVDLEKIIFPPLTTAHLGKGSMEQLVINRRIQEAVHMASMPKPTGFAPPVTRSAFLVLSGLVVFGFAPIFTMHLLIAAAAAVGFWSIFRISPKGSQRVWGLVPFFALFFTLPTVAAHSLLAWNESSWFASFFVGMGIYGLLVGSDYYRYRKGPYKLKTSANGINAVLSGTPIGLGVRGNTLEEALQKSPVLAENELDIIFVDHSLENNLPNLIRSVHPDHQTVLVVESADLEDKLAVLFQFWRNITFVNAGAIGILHADGFHLAALERYFAQHAVYFPRVVQVMRTSQQGINVVSSVHSPSLVFDGLAADSMFVRGSSNYLIIDVVLKVLRAFKLPALEQIQKAGWNALIAA